MVISLVIIMVIIMVITWLLEWKTQTDAKVFLQFKNLCYAILFRPILMAFTARLMHRNIVSQSLIGSFCSHHLPPILVVVKLSPRSPQFHP